jgi:regulator of replication initiation timing
LAESRAEVRDAEAMLARKRALKRYGLAAVLEEVDAEIETVQGLLAGPVEDLPPRKGRQPKDPYKPFKEMLEALRERRSEEEELTESIGGKLTENEVRELVLSRLRNSLAESVLRYARAERRNLASRTANWSEPGSVDDLPVVPRPEVTCPDTAPPTHRSSASRS